jgi:hypothetical protein
MKVGGLFIGTIDCTFQLLLGVILLLSSTGSWYLLGLISIMTAMPFGFVVGKFWDWLNTCNGKNEEVKS